MWGEKPPRKKNRVWFECDLATPNPTERRV
jgi:hypothetical protein